MDEIQEVPELMSYIQEDVDTMQIPSQYILTGSQNLEISQSVTQSLAIVGYKVYQTKFSGSGQEQNNVEQTANEINNANKIEQRPEVKIPDDAPKHVKDTHQTINEISKEYTKENSRAGKFEDFEDPSW